MLMKIWRHWKPSRDWVEKMKKKSHTQQQKNQKDQSTGYADLARQFTTALSIGTKRRIEQERKQQEIDEQIISALTHVGEEDEPRFYIPKNCRQVGKNIIWARLWNGISTVPNRNGNLFTKEAIDNAFAKWKGKFKLSQ